MTENIPERQPASILHSALSFFVPGLGQIIAGQIVRGITFLISFVVLAWLSVWTIAQRARFPDLDISFSLYVNVFLQVLALLLFVIALRHVLARFVIKDISGQTFLGVGIGFLYIVALIFSQERILAMAGSEEDLKMIYGGTAIFAASALAAFHLWQVWDAGRVGAEPSWKPSMVAGILLSCVVIFSLGWNITEINMDKAIAEYEDWKILLPRIFWPWQAAFEYEQIAIESTAKIQAPCPEGSVGPEVNEPIEGEAWISVTPTCGDITTRDLAQGQLSFGTELTIIGGGFQPGAEVEILWKNPIGNPFKPRGVGDTDIRINSNGEFETNLYIPEVIIPSTAVGEQVHTLIVRQESGVVFTGNPSPEIKLAAKGMLETIMIGLMATFFGVIFSFPFSFLAARNVMAPISSSLSGSVGGLVGLAPAMWVVGKITGAVTVSLGGLDEAPIQIALTGLISVFAFGYLGYKLGNRLFRTAEKQSPILGRVLTAAGLGTAGAWLGWTLGTGVANGIVSIPLAGAVPASVVEQYAYGGAILLGVGAAVYGFLSALREFSLGLMVYTVTRTIMNIVRSIEPLIWAIVAGIWVGLGPFAGTIALTLHTVAALGKLYSESIESIDPGPIEALQATGANRLQTIAYAIVPQILPPFISFTIYRWDINVRMSTIIGLVGGGGIGFILVQWIRLFQYEAVGLAVWLITITVATLDYISSNIRERFV